MHQGTVIITCVKIQTRINVVFKQYLGRKYYNNEIISYLCAIMIWFPDNQKLTTNLNTDATHAAKNVFH